jgi:two-component system, cell cycle sensor histidine kinase and response regulator CckA
MDALERCAVPHQVRIIQDGADLDEHLSRGEPSTLPDRAPSPGLILADAAFLREQGRRLEELMADDPALRDLPVVALDGSGSGAELPDFVHPLSEPDISGPKLEWILRCATERDRRIRAEGRTQERAKELHTLYRATELLNRSDPSFEERLRRLVDLLASGWRWPDLIQVRLTLGLRTFQTEGFRETPWMQETQVVDEDGGGRLQVALTRGPPNGEPAFLSEERELLDTLGRVLSDVLARESTERLLRLTFAGMQEALVVIDASHQARGIQYVNRAAERMFGYEADELLGGDTRRLHVDEDHFHRFGLESKEALDAEGIYFGTFPLRRKDGSVFQAEQTVSLLDPGMGHAAGAVSVIRDVSERSTAQAQLRRSEERFREIAEHIEDAFWIGPPDFSRLEYVSPASESIFGRSVEELYDHPRSWLDDVVPQDREKVATALARLTEGPQRAEFRIRRPDGAERWLLARSFPVRNEAGDVERIIGVARDVTEQEEMDQQLRQMQKMESVGQLAGGIAHDFNNLLTVIRAQTDLILMDLPQGQTSEDVALIQEATDRAATLTGHLLAFSREQVLQPRPVDLSEAVREFVRLLKPLVGEQIRIQPHLDEELPTVHLDLHQLEQIVLNLALNARDAMPRGGTLTISTSSEVLGPEQAEALGMESGLCAALAISDTGEGMSEAVLKRVFDPFFTTKPKGKGTGLGLAMVYGTVKQSGGSIIVESELGRGSTFVLRFPAMDAEGDEPVRVGVAGPPVAGSRPAAILVIEDDVTVRRMVSTVLTREGFHVREVESAERGLEVLESISDIDLVLTDLVLPGRSGLALMEELAESRPELPLIMMSGYALGAFEKPLELPSGATFLRKPFRPDELTEAIESALRGG